MRHPEPINQPSSSAHKTISADEKFPDEMWRE
jgi:hypothetical protein